MKIFDWIRSVRTSHVTYPESYALTRSSMWRAAKDPVRRLVKSHHSVLLVAHFPDTFEEIEAKVNEWGLDYEIPLQPFELRELSSHPSGSMHLTLAEMILDESDRRNHRIDQQKMAVVAFERHPELARDEQLRETVRDSLAKTELGYFLSLEDPVVKLSVSETAMIVLDQLGMNDHELITSSLVTKRLDRLLRKTAKQLEQSGREIQPADSAAEWLELNWEV